MNKLSMVALGLLLAAGQVSAASASDGTVSFTGNIVSQTCSVSVDGKTNSETVTLPKVATGVLNESGKIAGNTRFSLALSECSTKTGNVYAYFEQGANVNADGRLNNTGTAGNVQLQLRDGASNVIVAGSTDQSSTPATVTLVDGAATLFYSAEYFATGAATAGSVLSSVNYSINYL